MERTGHALRVTPKGKQLVSEVKNSKENYKDISLTKKRCPECNSFLKVRKTRD